MSSSGASVPPVLFADRGCPFAHRVQALLLHLGCPHDLRLARVGEKPDGLDLYSSCGRIPLLVDGEMVLTESRVMLEHLAEQHGFTDAYPADLAARSLHRHAMAVADDFLAPLLFGSVRELDTSRLEDVLTALEQATATVPPRPCLLALHLAPTWLGFRTLQPHGEVTRGIDARPALRAWLDAACLLECVARTAPDPAHQAEDLAHAREAGLLPADWP